MKRPSGSSHNHQGQPVRGEANRTSPNAFADRRIHRGMAARKTKAERDRIAAEAAAEVPAGSKRKDPTYPLPATAARKVDAVAATYRITPAVFTEKEGVYSWTAGILLGEDPVAKVSWNGAKKAATVSPITKTAAGTAAVKAFEAAAKRLLPGRDSITDLIIVLGVTSEPAISPANKLLLTKDVPGAAELIENPDRLVP